MFDGNQVEISCSFRRDNSVSCSKILILGHLLPLTYRSNNFCLQKVKMTGRTVNELKARVHRSTDSV